MDGHNPARQLALVSAVSYLRCPVCGSSMSLNGSQLACRRNHSFDVARHGYVNLGTGRAGPHTGDSAAMVAARDRFLSRGHYRPLAAAVRSRRCVPPGLTRGQRRLLRTSGSDFRSRHARQLLS